MGCQIRKHKLWIAWSRARCANAPPVLETDNQGRLPHDKLKSDHHYLHAVDQLKKSNVWSKHQNVRNWLNTTWLPLPQVYMHNIYTEAQNKLLKYSYVRKRKKLSLSSIIALLVQKSLPDMHRKYLFEIFKMITDYRQYKGFVPDYLHNRPRSVIKHCLESKIKWPKVCKGGCILHWWYQW